MRADWKEVPRDEVKGQWAALYVTMNPKGVIVMSRVTYERVGAPEAFSLLFDAANNRIGLKPTSPSMRNAYPVARQGRAGARLVRAYRLMQDYSIDLPETIQFLNPEIDQDGILVLDLRTARVSPRAINHFRKRNGESQKRRPGPI